LIQINAGGVIQDGVDFAVTGSTVNAGAGTYDEVVTISGKTNLTIQGVGDGTLIKPSTHVDNSAAIYIRNSDGLTINDIKVHTFGYEMEGIWVKGAFYDNDLSVTGLTIHHVTIIADGIGTNAGFIADASTDAAHSGWTITDNTITGNGCAMVFQDVTNSTVTGNRFSAPGNSGTIVLWTSERFNSSNLVFSHNILSGGGSNQVRFITDFNQSGSNVPAEGDPLFPSSIAGVTFHGNTFSNWTNGALKVGTLVESPNVTGTITGFDITENTFNMTGGTDDPIAYYGAPTYAQTPVVSGSGNIFNVSSTAKIQKAVNSALGNVTTGDVINVAAGTYDEVVTISGKTNLTLQGVGDGTLIEPSTHVDNSAAIYIRNSDGLTINDLKVHTFGYEMEGIWVKGALYENDLSVTGLTIHDVTILADGTGTNAGFIADASTDAAHSGWTITDNTITGNGCAMVFHSYRQYILRPKYQWYNCSLDKRAVQLSQSCIQPQHFKRWRLEPGKVPYGLQHVGI
jgi:hypothetical protein